MYARAACAIPSVVSALSMQAFYLGHSGDVYCLTVSPDCATVATGDVARHPTIVVWNAETGEAVQVKTTFRAQEHSDLGKMIISMRRHAQSGVASR